MESDASKEGFSIASDEELAERIARERREEDCAELFARYRKRIYLWCFGYAHDVEEAVDLSQEVFAKIFLNVGSFAGRSRFSTWAYEVARNHCLGELSRSRARWWRSGRSLDASDGLDVAGGDPLGGIETTGDLERLIGEAGRRMERDELEAFILHYHDGLTVKEITKLLRCENATGARTLIQNARRKFGRMIDEKGLYDA